MDGYITASDLALLTGKSKQWICTLCQQGRIEGARKEGNTWLLDPLTRLPESKFAERKRARAKALDALRQSRDMEEYEKSLQVVPDAQERRQLIAKYLDMGYDIDDEGAATRADGKVFRIRPWGEDELAWLAHERGDTPAAKEERLNPVKSRLHQIVNDFDRRAAITEYLDKGYEISEDGLCSRGEELIQIIPWGWDERKWLEEEKEN